MTCKGANECTKCDAAANYYFLNNTCYLGACPDGYYSNNLSEKLCVACDNTCKTCSVGGPD